MKFVICLLALLSIAFTSNAQCGAGGCGNGSSGVGLFRGRAIYQSNQSTCGPNGCGQSCSQVQSYYTTINTMGRQYRPGSIVFCTYNNYYYNDGDGWTRCNPPADGKFANSPDPKLQQTILTVCKDGKCTITHATGGCTTCCNCGCVTTGKCLCQNCDKHTADPTSPDYKPNVNLKSKLTEVTIHQGKALYQDDQNNLYILDKKAVEASTEIKPTGQYVWKQN